MILQARSRNALLQRPHVAVAVTREAAVVPSDCDTVTSGVFLVFPSNHGYKDPVKRFPGNPVSKRLLVMMIP